jgi:S-adenosyl-L-methionine hydrolase (adenosine-forming)
VHRIALVTDFGTRDPYVAAMKGVIASRTDAAIHDLTHEIAPFDVLEAAWFLRSVVSYWPAGTIFVCVVDPGVGTDRKIAAFEQDGRMFLAPDNGLLTFVWNGMRAYSVENEALFLPRGSHTFHGRDRFAPVAAALANGAPLQDAGPEMSRLVTLDYEPPEYLGTSEPRYLGDSGIDDPRYRGTEAPRYLARGTIVAIDRFGTAITDIERARLPFDSLALSVRGTTVDRVERTYGEAGEGPFLIVGSTGHLEISVANGSAAERLQLRRLDRVTVWQSDGASSRF